MSDEKRLRYKVRPSRGGQWVIYDPEDIHWAIDGTTDDTFEVVAVHMTDAELEALAELDEQ